MRPGLFLVTIPLEVDVNLHANGQVIRRLTRAQSNPDDGKNAVTHLGGNYEGKGAAEQPVPASYGVYPVYRITNLASACVHFHPENRDTSTQQQFERKE